MNLTICRPSNSHGLGSHFTVSRFSLQNLTVNDKIYLKLPDDSSRNRVFEKTSFLYMDELFQFKVFGGLGGRERGGGKGRNLSPIPTSFPKYIGSLRSVGKPYIAFSFGYSPSHRPGS